MAGLIAPESQRLLRMARQASKKGFDKTAELLASEGYGLKEKEPAIGMQEDIWKLQQGKLALGEEMMRARENEASQNLAGRIAFADELKQRAADENQPAGFDLRQFAEPRAAKLGISEGALASFFQRNKLPMTKAPATTTPNTSTITTPPSVIDATLKNTPSGILNQGTGEMDGLTEEQKRLRPWLQSPIGKNF